MNVGAKAESEESKHSSYIKFTLESQHVVHAFETNVFAKPLIKEGKVVGGGSLQLRKTNYLLVY